MKRKLGINNKLKECGGRFSLAVLKCCKGDDLGRYVDALCTYASQPDHTVTLIHWRLGVFNSQKAGIIMDITQLKHLLSTSPKTADALLPVKEYLTFVGTQTDEFLGTLKECADASRDGTYSTYLLTYSSLRYPSS